VTWFDHYADSLVDAPARLAAVDSWAERIARSTFLCELIGRGAVEEGGGSC
jgi:hypothetical protein